jgi:hypothetical protein
MSWLLVLGAVAVTAPVWGFVLPLVWLAVGTRYVELRRRCLNENPYLAEWSRARREAVAVMRLT